MCWLGQGQDKFIMRKSDNVDVDLREDCEEDLADVGHNADLYVVNQESRYRYSMMYDVWYRFDLWSAYGGRLVFV